MNTVKKIMVGYWNLIKKNTDTILAPFKIVLFLGIITALSFAIVYPLWSFANTNKELYSTFVVILIISLFAFFAIYKAARYVYFNSFKKLFKEIIVPFLIKFGRLSIFLFYIIITVYLLNISLVFGLISILIAIIVLGYIRFAFKKN